MVESVGHLDSVVILAAGAGTRMKSQKPKVLHEIAGRPLLGHVLAAVQAVGADSVVVVVGHQREAVQEYLAAHGLASVVQDQQLGTGDAVKVALTDVPDSAQTVMILAGDTPLLRPRTLHDMEVHHAGSGAAATVLTTHMADPGGYGRIVRHAGNVTRIVEHKDATADELAITEINSGLYLFDRGLLADALATIGTANAQGEQYLTDVVEWLVDSGHVVSGYVAADSDEIHGINDRVQLAAAGRVLRDRIVEEHMRNGVTFVDPATTWVDATARIAPDAHIERNCHLSGNTVVGSHAIIGPDTTLLDCRVDAGASVVRSHCDSATIGADATVGPFSFLRPGAVLGEGAKVGAYVEVKQATIGDGAKVPHLSYVGDATIGAGSNIGAATVFANYDGVAKHRTVVGEQVRIGSDTMLVAPVTVGDGAYTAAGSVITEDVPPGALGLGRARQRNIDGWVTRTRPDTASARAAEHAAESDQSDDS